MVLGPSVEKINFNYTFVSLVMKILNSNDTVDEEIHLCTFGDEDIE